MNKELKPCPFCGGEAVLRTSVFFKHDAYVRCKKCGAKSMSYPSASAEDARLRTIEAWNRRTKE